MFKKIKEATEPILKKTERFAKTDMTYVTKGSFWLTWGHIISTVAGLILLISFANLLPADVYGTYKFVINIASILTVFSLGGLTNSITQAVARGYEGSVEKAVQTRLSWGTLGLVAGLLISVYYFLNDNTLLALSMLLVGIFIPFLESFGIYESFLQGRKLFRESIQKFIITRIVTAVLMIATIFYTDNLFFVLLAYLLPLSAIRFYFYKRTLKKHILNSEVDNSTISYGKHLSLMATIDKFATYLDSILIFHFLGAFQVATYSFALAPIEQIKALYKNIPILSIPKLSNRSIGEINKLMRFRLSGLFLIGIIIAVIYIFLAPFIFQIIFPQYIESIIYTQVLAIIIAIRLPFAFLSSVIQSKLDITPKSWIYWRLTAPIILIISLLLLTPLYGIWGVVYAKIIFAITTYLVNWIQWKMFLRKSTT